MFRPLLFASVALIAVVLGSATTVQAQHYEPGRDSRGYGQSGYLGSGHGGHGHQGHQHQHHQPPVRRGHGPVHVDRYGNAHVHHNGHIDHLPPVHVDRYGNAHVHHNGHIDHLPPVHVHRPQYPVYQAPRYVPSHGHSGHGHRSHR